MLFLRVIVWCGAEKFSLKKSCFYLYIRRKYELCWNATRGGKILREVGAVNESDCVDIDTGALIFSTEMMKSLYSLIATEED